MSKSERLDVLMLRVAPLNEDKPGGRLTDRNTLKSYKTNILKFYEWSKALGISREHQIAKNGYSPQTLIQKYTDELVGKGLSAATIHTYLAPVCKGLGIGMEQIRKPVRRSAEISKNTKLNQNAAGARQAEDPRFARILRLAEIVAVRPRALARLTAQNLRQDENGDYIIAIRDKGGKESIQLYCDYLECRDYDEKQALETKILLLTHDVLVQLYRILNRGVCIIKLAGNLPKLGNHGLVVRFVCFNFGHKIFSTVAVTSPSARQSVKRSSFLSCSLR